MNFGEKEGNIFCLVERKELDLYPMSKPFLFILPFLPPTAKMLVLVQIVGKKMLKSFPLNYLSQLYLTLLSSILGNATMVDKSLKKLYSGVNLV